MSIRTFFYPESVAVVGASTDPRKVGYAILKNLLSDFTGKIYPINPKTNQLLGLTCYKSILDVEDKIDLAIISLPNRIVPSVIDECGKKGTKSVIIISAGFREIGEEGLNLERELLSLAEQFGIRIIGPNCLGILNTENGLNASFASRMPAKGNIGFLSQSGALCTAVLDWAEGRDIGFSKFISMGNKLDLNESDFLEFLIEDSQTSVIAMYLEDVKNGQRFMKVAKEGVRKKPILAIKAGVSEAGKKAASSHTGSLAGTAKAFEAAFKQAGIIHCESIEELFETACGFASQPLPRSNRVGIVTNAGGVGIIATDACEKEGLNVVSLSGDVVEELRKNLPANANCHNPVDILGDGDSGRYRLAISTLKKEENVDGIFCILTPQAMTEIEKTAEVLVTEFQGSPKPIFPIFMGGEDISKGVEILKSGGLFNYSYPEITAKVFSNMVKYLNLKQSVCEMPIKKFNFDKSKIERIIKNVQAENRLNLTQFEALEVISTYGISIPKMKIATSSNDAMEAAEEIGFPVALKILSPEISHKTEVGGVVLNLKNKQEVKENYELMLALAKKYLPNVSIYGVLVSESLPPSKEVIIGMIRDLQLGPLIMFGLGGIYTEILKDVSFRIAPITEIDAKNMVYEIKSFPILSGARGQKPVNIDEIIESLLKVSALVIDFPEITVLDINPLFVSEAGVVAVDAKITIKTNRELAS